MSRRTDRWGTRALYYLLLPAIVVAASILGYFLWRSTTRYARLGEQTIVESTLLLVREKVDTIEQFVISADNAVFGLVDLEEPEAIEHTWPPVSATVSPSVSALLVLDDSGQVLAHVSRGDAASKRQFLRVLLDRIVPSMELEQQPLERLKHLHGDFAGRNYLISYKVVRHRGRRFYLVAHHDTAYIVREKFPQLFATEEAKRHYNVIDDQNRYIYGRDLARAGDYLVGLRFPTTLYGWRLQVAPKQAPELESQGRTRRVGEIVLIGSSFVIIVLGLFFLAYAMNKERRLNELKSEFIANVSHELKTPLSVVRMFGEMLLTSRVRSEAKKQEYLEIICRESERLTALIENVLDFSALERGKIKYDLRPGALADVVTQAIETFRYRVEQEGIEVELHAEPLPPVDFDEQSVVLAVINLLDNAVKYGGRTPIEVLLRPKPRWVEVSVRDHGPGIPDDAQRRVFERFYRGRRDASTRGSGIGLALVKHIAEAHGGRAWASNAEGGGAVVSFSIPIEPERGETRRSKKDRVDSAGSGVHVGRHGAEPSQPPHPAGGGRSGAGAGAL
jgi:two-component system phosphate regulon sensor histidine kinase PhoR